MEQLNASRRPVAAGGWGAPPELEIRLYPRAMRPTTAEEHAVGVVRSGLEGYGKHIRRVGIRLDQIISAPGKLHWACRVEVTLVKVVDAPKFYVEARARTEQEAVALAGDAILDAVRREVEEAERRRDRARKPKVARRKAEGAPRLLEVRRTQALGGGETEAELAERDREAAKERHLTPRSVKTAHPLRGRHIHKTQRQARATSARELSAAERPSRKSTRKSANRSKRDSNQARRHERELRSPKTRATRAIAGASQRV